MFSVYARIVRGDGGPSMEGSSVSGGDALSIESFLSRVGEVAVDGRRKPSPRKAATFDILSISG